MAISKNEVDLSEYLSTEEILSELELDIFELWAILEGRNLPTLSVLNKLFNDRMFKIIKPDLNGVFTWKIHKSAIKTIRHQLTNCGDPLVLKFFYTLKRFYPELDILNLFKNGSCEYYAYVNVINTHGHCCFADIHRVSDHKFVSRHIWTSNINGFELEVGKWYKIKAYPTPYEKIQQISFALTLESVVEIPEDVMCGFNFMLAAQNKYEGLSHKIERQEPYVPYSAICDQYSLHKGTLYGMLNPELCQVKLPDLSCVDVEMEVPGNLNTWYFDKENAEKIHRILSSITSIEDDQITTANRQLYHSHNTRMINILFRGEREYHAQIRDISSLVAGGYSFFIQRLWAMNKECVAKNFYIAVDADICGVISKDTINIRFGGCPKIVYMNSEKHVGAGVSLHIFSEIEVTTSI